jgi:hypothetical protein
VEPPLCGRKKYIFILSIVIALLLYTPIVTEMLLAVLSVCSVEELAAIYTDRKETDMSISTPEEIQQMKNKIHTAGKMYEVFQILRFVLLPSLVPLYRGKSFVDY